MFVNEKELVEKLVLDLQERFGTQYIVRELRGGNNIADIVYTTDINRSNIVFDEYFNAYYYFNGIYNHKKVSLDEVRISDKKVNKKFHHFLRELEDLGYIKISGNYITSVKKIDSRTRSTTSCLRPWRGSSKAYARRTAVRASSCIPRS